MAHGKQGLIITVTNGTNIKENILVSLSLLNLELFIFDDEEIARQGSLQRKLDSIFASEF